ncbi:RNA polymerase sigma factor [Cytophaga hutchinsonii]|jgi:RNA polymerase sigma factor (sigma-70 family)|uniref:RNA polymerase, sigma-E factor heat shock and oxidative stress n=1 Tax=Cytophaga hutchinsonii (strain ATCC 33406 / DSM 1761 / CIP 103989 / NBRC 15051 / NCIMB 9469 / D465) TaxID=269798 RepID=A0A6N4SPN4_CYTH3|nr:sigma-70 family RNA polymerase sigma factor [Cytophaga hutchinsonii]ABG58230.1 RNA polymerase, sigma-E factor; heat shock and oxidative stress [Cytophaga hutchinsonii ATCC 33406]SFX54494.1 RNA polymerase sigma factor, sigma-70 family [Cytophaga hutchinsonii ATCC 33406]
MNDQEILARLKQGDENTLDLLYKKNYRMMVKLIVKNNGSEEEAKDVYQDSLIVLWQKARDPDFVLTSKISTYLYSICLNLWRKELERKKRFSYEVKDEVDVVDLDKNERIKIINKCIQQLGETCRDILTYYYFDRLSMVEIAEKMGFANSDTSKTKKYKCKKELDLLVKSLYKESDFLD